MRRRHFFGIAVALLIGVAPLAWEATAHAAEGERELVVVVNPSNDVSNITLDDLRNIYLGKRRFWADQTRVRMTDLIEEKTPEAKTAYTLFAQRYLHKDPNALKSYWIKMIFSGAGQPPHEMESPEQVIDYVAHEEGGIGYLYADQVTDAVRVVAISRPER